MLSKKTLATVADFTAKVLLDRETQTGYVRGIVEFPNRLPATETGAETIYAPVVTIVADEFRLSRTEALASLAQIAVAKPDTFGWLPERRTIRIRDKQTGQPTGETAEREVHHLWLKSRMQARVSALDPLAKAAAETRARVHASLR
jgi:hypothetical protein